MWSLKYMFATALLMVMGIPLILKYMVLPGQLFMYQVVSHSSNPISIQAWVEVLCVDIQHFLEHEETGQPRSTLLNSDLTTAAGVDTAVMFLYWLGKGLPGWKPGRGRKPKDANTTVVCI